MSIRQHICFSQWSYIGDLLYHNWGDNDNIIINTLLWHHGLHAVLT